MLMQIPFSGFYESHHSDIIDDELESFFRDDYDNTESMPSDFWQEVDYGSIHQAYAKRYVENFETELNALLEVEPKRDPVKFTFKELVSPREYNFSTDRILVDIDVSLAFRMRQEVDTEIFNRVIKENCTSYDGFISYYTNEPNPWLEKAVSEYDHNELYLLFLAWLETLEIVVDENGLDDLMIDAMREDCSTGIMGNLIDANMGSSARSMANAAYADRCREEVA